MQRVRTASFTGFPPTRDRRQRWAENSGFRVGDVGLCSAKVFADLGIRHTSHFPGTVEVLEASSLETIFREIPKHEVAFGDRRCTSPDPTLSEMAKYRSRSSAGFDWSGMVTRSRKNSEALAKSASVRARKTKWNSESSGTAEGMSASDGQTPRDLLPRLECK